MKVSLIRFTPEADKLCGEAAAICISGKSPEKSLAHAMASGHLSVTEHGTFTFRVEGVSRVLLAQLTRHRMASFDVESQRYVTYSLEPEWIVPPSFMAAGKAFVDHYLTTCRECWKSYQKFVEAGIDEEDARFFFPGGCPTRLIVTMNGRELLHFFSLRCCFRAQWEIRELAETMLASCRCIAPQCFEHAGPQCAQLGYCPEKSQCRQMQGIMPTLGELRETWKKQRDVERWRKSHGEEQPETR